MHGAAITALPPSDCRKASPSRTVTKQLIHILNRGGHCAFELMWATLNDGPVSRILAWKSWKGLTFQEYLDFFFFDLGGIVF